MPMPISRLLPLLPLALALNYSSYSSSSSFTSTFVSSIPAVFVSSTTTTASSVSTQPVIQPSVGNVFTPFAVLSDTPKPGYPATDPSNPPDVDSGVIPDFGPAWANAWQKAKSKITEFSLEEKVNVTTGVGWARGRCSGNIPPLEPVRGRGWPGLCLEDSPLGVRGVDFATAFPAGINAAASFNRGLMRLRGIFMGREHVGKGVNIVLGPMMNMGRVAEGGRNWEGFGADPFLTGEAAYETVLGLQQGGVIACAKHLVGNEQEYKRMTESSDIDDRTMHEVYSHPFLKSVMAGIGSMMCSYNLLNGTYACDNNKVMNDIVKREYGFQGFIMSDWFAQHDTISAMTGLDMTMPGDLLIGLIIGSNTSYFGANLTAYVQNGSIPESRLDDMVTRILASWYFLNQDSPSYPPVSFDSFQADSDQYNAHIDVQDSHYKLVREMGAASIVLLKNKNNALPLGEHEDKPAERTLVLIGSDAGPGRMGPNEFPTQAGVITGTLAMGWGSGTANFTYLVNPLQAIQRRARKYRTSISWLLDDYDLSGAGNIALKKSAALVFLKSDSGEAFPGTEVDGNDGDRKNLTAWAGGDDLVLAVAAQNNNTIVIVHSVGPLILEPWIDHPNVTAVVWAGLPGQESGNSLVDVLYGDWNPSGRLPYTIAKDINDWPAQRTLGGGSDDIISIPYTEGLFIDYRHFDANNIAPRFEFGFGLSYTQFEYSKLEVKKIAFAEEESDGDAELVKAWEQGEATPIAEGMSRAFWLHKPAYQVGFWVQNIGKVYGGEIPQLYVHFPGSSGEPPSVLRGFTNTEIETGQGKWVTITVSRYGLSVWDVERQGWRKPDGEISVTVGASSRDGRLNGVNISI